MSEVIHSVHIRQTETRQAPSAHTVYRIEIQAPVRTWSVWRRYSEFSALRSALMAQYPTPSPPELPSKSFWPHTFSDTKKVEDRRSGLESFLHAILSSKDDRWRSSREWAEFLGVPTVRGGEATVGTHYTSESWLDEYREMLGIARDVRSLLNRREAHMARNEISAAHSCNLQARTLLSQLGTRVTDLEAGLEALAAGGTGELGAGKVMSPGELRRRQDMMNLLRDEKDSLLRLVATSRTESAIAESTARKGVGAAAEDRHALLGNTAVAEGGVANGLSRGDYGFPAPRQPHAAKPASRRVFGKTTGLPNESKVTRGLDNEGLLVMQQQQMLNQDLYLEQFSSMLQRQKQIGVVIADELDLQNALLEETNERVNKTNDKLKYAQKKLGKIR